MLKFTIVDEIDTVVIQYGTNTGRGTTGSNKVYTTPKIDAIQISRVKKGNGKDLSQIFPILDILNSVNELSNIKLFRLF